MRAQNAQFITSHNPKSPFPVAVLAGDIIYVSGQIGTAPGGGVFKDMDAAARADMRDVAHCTIMLTDM